MTELTDELYGSGAAAEVLQAWSTVLTTQAVDLVPTQVIEAETASIAAYVD